MRRLMMAMIFFCTSSHAGVKVVERTAECDVGRPDKQPAVREVRPAPADGSVYFAPNGQPLPVHLQSPMRRCVPRAPYYLNGVLIINDFYCNG